MQLSLFFGIVHVESGHNQVKIRSKSGPGGGFGGGWIQRGRSGWEGSVALPESLDCRGKVSPNTNCYFKFVIYGFFYKNSIY